MDYEVLLLSRIQETYRRTGDNTAAIADGLTKTGRVITGAALIMVAVFAAFGLSDGLVIKSLGIGMAIAVFIDATVIRALLVPATMRLLGTRTWWAPGPLAAFTSRLGFDHADGVDPRGWFGPDRRVGLPDGRPHDGRHDRRDVGTGVGLSGPRPESAMG
jgi:RND superfamily putative drug exporter